MTDWAALEKPVKRRRIGKTIKGGPRESEIQREIVKALRGLGFIVHADTNGAALGGDEFAKVKQSSVLTANGRVKGWLDLAIVNRRGLYRGVTGYMEIKRPGGAVSFDQERIGELLTESGVPVAFVCSLDEALSALKQWGWI